MKYIKTQQQKKNRFRFFIPVRVVSLTTLSLIIVLCILLIPNWNKNEGKYPIIETPDETYATPVETPEPSEETPVESEKTPADIPSISLELPEQGYQSRKYLHPYPKHRDCPDRTKRQGDRRESKHFKRNLQHSGQGGDSSYRRLRC